MGLIATLHGTVDRFWSLALQAVGLERLPSVGTCLALGLSLLNTLVTLPLLAIFAR